MKFWVGMRDYDNMDKFGGDFEVTLGVVKAESLEHACEVLGIQHFSDEFDESFSFRGVAINIWPMLPTEISSDEELWNLIIREKQIRDDVP